MKVLILAAKLMEVPDDWNNKDAFLVRYDLAEKQAEQDTEPYSETWVCFPTLKGFFQFEELEIFSRILVVWAAKQVGQPLPKPSHPQARWITPEERKAYDEGLK
jgi:hypothetical protein